MTAGMVQRTGVARVGQHAGKPFMMRFHVRVAQGAHITEMAKPAIQQMVGRQTRRRVQIAFDRRKPRLRHPGRRDIDDRRRHLGR